MRTGILAIMALLGCNNEYYSIVQYDDAGVSVGGFTAPDVGIGGSSGRGGASASQGAGGLGVGGTTVDGSITSGGNQGGATSASGFSQGGSVSAGGFTDVGSATSAGGSTTEGVESGGSGAGPNNICRDGRWQCKTERFYTAAGWSALCQCFDHQNADLLDHTATCESKGSCCIFYQQEDLAKGWCFSSCFCSGFMSNQCITDAANINLNTGHGAKNARVVAACPPLVDR